MSEKIDKKFAYSILKQGLFDYYNIAVVDENLLEVLNAATGGDEGALKYLHKSTEIQQLLSALQGEDTTYTVKNLDTILSHLRKNIEYKDTIPMRFSDFYEETFSDMLKYLKDDLLWIDSFEKVLMLTDCFRKKVKDLQKVQFPDGYNEITFVIKTIFDIDDGALVHKILLGKTPGSNEDKQEEISYSFDSNEDFEGFNQFQDSFLTGDFITVLSKKVYNKEVILATLENIGYGDNLFNVFRINQRDIT